VSPIGARQIRPATPDDAAVIFDFIRALAEYEREPDAVVTRPEVLREQLGQARPPFECLLCEVEGRPVGFALFFPTYSTWLGKPGIHLEDLFVLPEERGHGHGKALLQAVARLAVQRGCGRLEWAVLDWNTPAIRFYESLGASALGEWTTFRVAGAALAALGEGAPRPVESSG
jgi:GNAT superfamily N-acetyltransferase